MEVSLAHRPASAGAPRSAIRHEDLLIALAVGAVQLTGSWFASRHQHTHRAFDVFGALLVVAAGAALVPRRNHPIGVLATVYVTTLAYACLGYPHGPIFFALIIAYMTAVQRGRRRVAWWFLPLGWFTFLWVPHMLGRERAPTWGGIFGLAAWLLVLGAAAELIRARREHVADQARAAAAEAKRRTADERVRIARDLHDIVAHNISLINVQAGVALHLIDEQPEQARVALAAIKQASKETLGELRWVLDTLRGSDDVAPRAPAPQLDDLPQLVARTSAAGLPTSLVVHGERRPLGSAVELAAYRIVQEALTNVTRHAHASNAAVLVEYRPRDVVVQIDDDGAGSTGAGAATISDGGGTGIVGMRERAAALDGTLDAGPADGGGFRVRAVFPVGAAVPEPEVRT